MKTLIAYATIAISTVLFTFGPAHAFFDNGDFVQDGRNNGEFSSRGNAEGRGTANFTMSFSGSATTKGDFDANGMTQNLFDNNTRSYRPYYYPHNYEFPAEAK